MLSGSGTPWTGRRDCLSPVSGQSRNAAGTADGKGFGTVDSDSGAVPGLPIRYGGCHGHGHGGTPERSNGAHAGPPALFHLPASACESFHTRTTRCFTPRVAAKKSAVSLRRNLRNNQVESFNDPRDRLGGLKDE